VTDAQRIAKLEEALAERDARIAALEAQVAKLIKENERLADRLGQNSSNSSKPPSSDRGQNPHRNANRGKKGSGRKRGGQKGHRGHHRQLLPPESVDETHDVYPTSCEGCGKNLPQQSDTEPLRHQVTELPDKLTHVQEWRLHAADCRCGHRTRAVLPDGVPTGAFGPRLVATVALLTGLYRLSKRNTRRLLSELFGVEICEATISTAEHRVSKALAAPHQQLHRHIRRIGLVHADETSWREQNEGCWLWVACTTMVAFFLIQTRRTGKAAKKLLGTASRAAILVTDRLGSYNWWTGPRQVCWSHVTRTLTSLAEAKEGSFAHRYGTALLGHKDQMFKWWHRVRDGTLSHSTFGKYMRPVIAEFRKVLDEASHCGCTKTEGKVKALLGDWDDLWTFVRIPNVPPTNNEAERDLRHAVILRSLTHGTQSERGSRFIERILSAVETLRKQKRGVLVFLEEALVAHESGRPSPSLLPRAA
jgi:transposase